VPDEPVPDDAAGLHAANARLRAVAAAKDAEIAGLRAELSPGRARGIGVLRAVPECSRGAADRLRERAATAGREAHGRGVRYPGLGRLGGQGPGRASAQLQQAGFDEAMVAALTAEQVLAAGETR
jgi:hypothetical protein